MCCPKPSEAPHQNTPESIAKGNALLAEAKALRDMGVSLRKTSQDLEERSTQAFDLARSKQGEAEQLLLGRKTFGY